MPYPAIEAVTGIVGQGGTSSGAQTSAFVKTGLQPHVPLPATQLTPSEAMQAGRHRGNPSQGHDRAGEGQQGPRAHSTSKPRDRAVHDGNGSRFSEPEGLWAKLAKLLNQYDINASPQGVGRHNQPHCGVGLGRKGAKLVIQLQYRSTRLVMRIELDPAVAAILKPSFEALEEASNERFTLVANTQKRKHYQIQLSPVVMDRRASPQELERAILAFGHRVDKVRTAFRDELNRLPRESLGQEGLSANAYDPGTVHHDPFGEISSDPESVGQERGGDDPADQGGTQDEAWPDEAETDEDWPG